MGWMDGGWGQHANANATSADAEDDDDVMGDHDSSEWQAASALGVLVWNQVGEGTGLDVTDAAALAAAFVEWFDREAHLCDEVFG